MKKTNKVLSLVLAVLLCVGMLPISTLTAFAADTHKHCVCGGNTDIGDHTSHTNISFDEWTSTDSMPNTTGNYVLMNDVTLDDDWETADGTVLCLNGKKLTLEAVNVNANYNFTLCDCAGNGKIIGSGGSVYTIAMAGSATFTMYGGTVSGGNGQSGIHVYGSFNMYGGIITNGDADGTMNVNCKNGGGVYIESMSSAATMTMYGGSITGNKAANVGGGVFVEHNAKFIMNGGSITNNTSKETGGGVHNNGTFIINGGTITENISTDSTGGGVWSANNTTISISGDTIITENTGSSTTNNLHLAGDGTNNAKIAVGTMGTSASVGVSTDTNHSKEISVGGKDYKNNFFFDNTGYVIAVDGDNLKLVEATSVQVGKVNLYDGEYTTDGETKTADTPTGTVYAYYTSGVLKLNNFEYEGAGAVDSTDINAKEGIIYTTNDLKIEVIGENTFNLDREHDLLAAIFVKADLEIYGGGVLNIESDSIYEETSGIRGEGAITHTIKDITLNISLNQNESQGIHNQITGNKVIIDNAVINIDTMGRCFQVGHIQATNSIMSLTSATSNCLRGFRGLDLNNCYVNAKGEAVISVNSDTNYAINIGSGHYIFDGSNETYGAIYRGVTNLNLPSSYNYRTDKTAEFINSTTPFAHDNDEKYIEIYTDDWNIPVEAEWSADSLTYNGTEQAITATIKNKADVNDDVELVLTGNKGTNANTYTATVTGLIGKDAVKYTLVGGQNLTKNWEITKANQSAPTTPVGVNTTYIDTTDGKITGVDSTMEYRKEGDANYTAVTGTEITNLAAGTYYVRYAANGNYNASPDEQIIISLGGKRTPTIDTDPTASRVIIGGKLSDSTLTGGVASVDGEFAWVNPDMVMNTAGKFDMLVRFTPSSTVTYNTVDFEIEVEVVVCDTASGEHDFTEQMNNADEHWTVCAKCGVEKTDSREAHKGGTATCTAKAKCSVCGEEYGKMLDHKYEWVIDKEPTATEEGLKHEECTVCKAKQNENTAIPKTEINSPQTGDNSNMALWLALLFISGMGIVATTAYGRKKRTN